MIAGQNVFRTMVRACGRAALPLALLLAILAARGQAPASGRTVTVQLLAINDFHGNLEPPSGANGMIQKAPAGGAEYLATHLKADVAQEPNSIIVAAGDLIGASPLMSALFHDEPTIEALNAMNLAVSSVGNHEFDHGWNELMRMQNGGCHPSDGCQGGHTYAGAKFRYLSANVVRKDGGAPFFPATSIQTVGGVKIGFIGETLKGTAEMVMPSGIQGLVFLDEATTANRYAAQLKQQGVRAIVLLIHQGGIQNSDPEPNACNNFSGDIIPIVQKLSGDIQVVVSGHSHQFYNCTIAGHTVTSASSYGRMVTHIRLTIDAATDTITGVAASNEIVTRDVAKDAAQSRIIAQYGALSAPIANRVVGSAIGEIPRAANAAGESAMGDLIADAQLAATSSAAKGGAAVAFMNPGGIRADITGGEGNSARVHPVTYQDLFTIQPFGDVLTVMTVSGDVLKRLLEQQFDNPSAGQRRFLQVSNGFTYSYRLSAPPGRRIDAASIQINGRRISPGDKVRIEASDFLVDGGDGFTVFKEGTDRLGGEVDVEALVAYVRAHSPVGPQPQNRIVKLD